jgi:excisionase family DNA binding protein
MLDQISTCWFTRTEAAQYARVSVTTLDRWAREGKITRHKTPGGRGVRYTKIDIDNAMTPETV